MNDGMILTRDRSKIAYLTRLIVLTGIATIVPLYHQQFITGPIVNATLFATTLLLGTQAGIFMGIIPSLIALSVGLLSPALSPMVPFIMMSNIILVLSFGFLKDKSYWLAVGLASFLKFLFLFGTSSVVINLLFKKEIASSIAMMMSWPQLLTALTGGALAYLSVKLFKRYL